MNGQMNGQSIRISITVNRERHELEVEPHETLLERVKGMFGKRRKPKEPEAGVAN